MQTFIAYFEKLHSQLLDLLFPIHCLGCKKEGFWICQKCIEKIPLAIEQKCPLCERVTTPQGKTCLACKRKTRLDGMLTTSNYENQLVRKAVHNFKYRFASGLSVPLGNLLTKAYLDHDLALPDLIIPIPLHSRRLRWRGFNQAEMLAKQFAKNLTPGFPIVISSSSLIRKKYTSPQMQISNFQARFQNIKDAFRVSNQNLVQNKSVLLVDDIATTGSTIFECAKILKNAGAKEVFAIVLARQGFK